MTDDRSIIPAPDSAISPALSPDPENNAALAYLATLSSESRRTMLGALKTIAGMFNTDPLAFQWHKLTPMRVQLIRSKLADGYAPKTANRYLSALRGVFDACWRIGLLSAEQRERLKDLKPIRGKREPKGRHIERDEFKALLETCTGGDRVIAVRDAALIALLYTTGLRREEAATAMLQDFNRETGELRVVGKGNKQRTVDVLNKTAVLVATWIALRGDQPGCLFLHVYRSGKIGGKGISGTAIYQMLAKHSTEAGIDRVAPHDLRRTLISNLWDENVDGALIVRITGHANIQTAVNYDRRKDRARQVAAALIDLPD